MTRRIFSATRDYVPWPVEYLDDEELDEEKQAATDRKAGNSEEDDRGAAERLEMRGSGISTEHVSGFCLPCR